MVIIATAPHTNNEFERFVVACPATPAPCAAAVADAFHTPWAAANGAPGDCSQKVR
ncbi:hypothetical protein [Streptomyces sp. NPDC004296]|uniref:hypothetical protein n=1 Tax=Streptomyces sp. NPDC004296 TaxID=3364697 RepID=UPI00368C76AC